MVAPFDVGSLCFDTADVGDLVVDLRPLEIVSIPSPSKPQMVVVGAKGRRFGWERRINATMMDNQPNVIPNAIRPIIPPWVY